MKNTIANKQLKIAYCLIAFAYTVSSIRAPYVMSPLFKALPVLLLMIFAWHNFNGRLKALLIFALGFSAAGDIALALEFRNRFVTGLGAFLVAHIGYLLAFLPFCRQTDSKFKTLLCGLLLSYCLITGAMILPEETVLQMAVITYMLVLSAMCCSAIFAAKKNARLHVFGVFVFAVSDSIIAWDAFRQPLPYASIWIMSSYYLAQACILFGIKQLNSAISTTANALHEK